MIEQNFQPSQNYTQQVEGTQDLNFVDRVEIAAAELFMEALTEVYEGKGGKGRETLGKFQEIQEVNLIDDTSKREARYEDIVGKFDPMNEVNLAKRTELADLSAKLANVKRKARKWAITELSEERNAISPATADSPEYVFNKMAAAGVPAERVQEIIDESSLSSEKTNTPMAGVAFSGTAHPTQIQSRPYIQRGMEADRLMDDPEATREEMKEAYKAMIEVPITLQRKDNEILREDARDIFNMYYDALPEVADRLRKALVGAGYDQEQVGDHVGVEIRSAMSRMDFWQTGGDGDGNPNIDADALRDAVAMMRENIRERYTEDLYEVIEQLRDDSAAERAQNAVRDLMDKLEGPDYTLDAFKRDIAVLLEVTESVENADARKMLEDFVLKAEAFELIGPQTNLRHNALDLTATMATTALIAVADETGLLEGAGYANVADFEQAMKENPVLTETIIIRWLHDPEAMDAMRGLDPKDMENETAARIYERLQIVSENQDAVNMLIIAENESAGNVLAALTMLKVTQVSTEEKDASVFIVPLVESVGDLQKFPETMEKLLKNIMFRDQIREMGNTMTIMIAKSDTVRQSGMGALGAQEEAIGKAVIMAAKNRVDLNVFVGGGEALTRDGGNKLSENPHFVAIAVAREIMLEIRADKKAKEGTENYVPTDEDIKQFIAENNIKMPSVQATSQGHGQTTKFSGPSVAEYTIVSTVSQQVYATAQLAMDVPAKNLYAAQDERGALLDAIEDARKGYAASVKEYEAARANGSVDAYSREGMPVMSIKAAAPFLSNRPAKHGELMPKADRTVDEIKGKKQAYFENRAITTDRLGANAGSYPNADLGQAAGLKVMDDIESAFKYDKTFRDKLGRMAELLDMKNYEQAWEMMGKEQPGPEQRRALASAYDTGKVNSSEVTLAWLEQNSQEVAKLIVKAAFGEDIRADQEIDLKEPLRQMKPDLAKRTERREKDYRFGEADMVQLTQWANDNSEKKVSEALFNYVVANFAAADGRNVGPTSSKFLSADVSKQPFLPTELENMPLPNALGGC